MASLTYESAGVDLKLYDEAMKRLPALMARTHTPRVVAINDAFGGLFRLNHSRKPGQHSYEDPVLVSGTDGVGTKLKVAIQLKSYKTVGIDLVGMSVNDVLCMGAEPLFFLDYLALGKDDPDLVASLVEGVAKGCEECGAALLGGETAIMPDIYAAGDFDMAGFCTGVVERKRLIDGKAVKPGDVLIGLPSSGFHSNGYSLVRKVVFEVARLKVEQQIPELGTTVGEALLKPTRLYVRQVLSVLRRYTSRIAVSGLAHITGGGLRDNIERFLPPGAHVVIDRKSWEVPALFRWLQSLGGIDREEMYKVFNMGIGFVLIVRPQFAASIEKQLVALGENPVRIGEVKSGEAGVEYVG